MKKKRIHRRPPHRHRKMKLHRSIPNSKVRTIVNVIGWSDIISNIAPTGFTINAPMNLPLAYNSAVAAGSMTSPTSTLPIVALPHVATNINATFCAFWDTYRVKSVTVCLMPNINDPNVNATFINHSYYQYFDPDDTSFASQAIADDRALMPKTMNIGVGKVVIKKYKNPNKKFFNTSLFYQIGPGYNPVQPGTATTASTVTDPLFFSAVKTYVPAISATFCLCRYLVKWEVELKSLI